LDPKDLAELSGVPRSTIYEYERGDYQPRTKALHKLVDGFAKAGVRVDVLELYRSLPRRAGAQFREDAPSEDAA
jgi:predicted transcriptional regulator